LTTHISQLNLCQSFLILFLFNFSGLFVGTIFSQSSINSGGFDIEGQQGTLSISIGQADFSSLRGSTHLFYLGVQHPFERSVILIDESRECLIYPNPSHESIIVSTTDPDFLEYSYHIYSIDAKKISMGEQLKISESIQIKDLPIGMYIVWIRNNKNQNWYCKFIKS